MAHILLTVAVFGLVYWSIYLLAVHWYVSVPIGVAIVAAIIAHKQSKAKKCAVDREHCRKTAAESAARKQSWELEFAQRQVQMKLELCVSSSAKIVEGLRWRDGEVEKALASAEHNFARRAYTPFWEGVEHAAAHLAEADIAINQIIQNAKDYRETAKAYGSVPPVFVVEIESLANALRLAERMQGVVGAARGDSQFAAIYRQRNARRLSIRGFTNLAEALDCMRERLGYSADDLVRSLSEIAEANRNNREVLEASVQKFRDRMERDAAR